MTAGGDNKWVYFWCWSVFTVLKVSGVKFFWEMRIGCRSPSRMLSFTDPITDPILFLNKFFIFPSWMHILMLPMLPKYHLGDRTTGAFCSQNLASAAASQQAEFCWSGFWHDCSLLCSDVPLLTILIYSPFWQTDILMLPMLPKYHGGHVHFLGAKPRRRCSQPARRILLEWFLTRLFFAVLWRTFTYHSDVLSILRHACTIYSTSSHWIVHSNNVYIRCFDCTTCYIFWKLLTISRLHLQVLQFGWNVSSSGLHNLD